MSLLKGADARADAGNRRALYVWLPATLTVAFACASFWPSRTAMIGEWQDVPFNVWNFVFLWRRLDALGPLALFARELWNAPVFPPGELHLALSENQLWPALILWPLWRATGSAVFTLDLGALLLSLAACASVAAWLGARGVRDLKIWGGLCYAACGWMQCHYVHWQNCCIFVLPLALYAWERFRAKPDWRRLCACAFLFGWITGWNLYFAVMAGALLAALCAQAWIQGALPRWRLLLLGAGALLVAAPVLSRYIELAHSLGGFGVVGVQAADLWSWLERAARPTALEAAFSFWPRASPSSLEGVGWLGFIWVSLALAAALRLKQARAPLGFALFAMLVSLGPGHLFYALVGWLPGVDSLRAIGRLQLGVLLGSLPAVFALLESLRGWRRWLPLALLLLELMPASAPLRMEIPEPEQAREGPRSALADALAESAAPVLVLPGVSPWLQLAAERSDVPLIGGYSGRTPLPDALLDELSTVRTWPLEPLLDFTRAHRLLTLGDRTEEARRSNRVRLRRCVDFHGGEACLFDVVQPPPDEPLLELATDVELTTTSGPGGARTRGFARRAGRLDHDGMEGCKLLRIARWAHLPAIESNVLLIGYHFDHIRFIAGAEIFACALPDPWRSWPQALRPQISAQLVCNHMISH